MTDIDELAQIIREVDGDNTLGAGALAEQIIARWNRRTISMQEAARVLFAEMTAPNEVPDYVILAGCFGDPLGGDVDEADRRAVYSGALLSMIRALAEGERG